VERRDHHVLQFQLEVADRLAVTIGAVKLEDSLGNKSGDAMSANFVKPISDRSALALVWPPAVETVDARGWVTFQSTLETSIQDLCLSSVESPLMSPICRYASIAMLASVVGEEASSQNWIYDNLAVVNAWRAVGQGGTSPALASLLVCSVLLNFGS
jgi:hypothetical protein